MKCIKIYLLFLRIMVLEQLPRGNVNIVIAVPRGNVNIVLVVSVVCT